MGTSPTAEMWVCAGILAGRTLRPRLYVVGLRSIARVFRAVATVLLAARRAWTTSAEAVLLGAIAPDFPGRIGSRASSSCRVRHFLSHGRQTSSLVGIDVNCRGIFLDSVFSQRSLQ